MGYAKSLFKGGVTVSTLTIIGIFLGYILRLYLARNFSVTDFGLFYAIMAFVSLFVLFRDFGLTLTLSRFISEFHEKKKKKDIKSAIITVLFIETALSIVVMLPIIIFSDFIAINYFKTISASLPLKILSFSFIVSTPLLVFHSVLQGLNKMAHYSILEPLRNFFVLISTILLLYLGVVGISISYLISGFILSIIFFIFVVRSFPFFKVKFKINPKLTKKLLFFAMTLLFV